jgi:Fur family ferric uptake transcriptional regulator
MTNLSYTFYSSFSPAPAFKAFKEFLLDQEGLKKAGLKVTGPRVRILHALKTAKSRHLSAEDIYQYLRDTGVETSLATIYRVLTQFETAGFVIRHYFEGEHSVFELDDKAHHDHLVCIACSAVVEFVDEFIEEKQLEIAKQHQFRMTDHALSIFGVCAKCQLKGS